MGNLYDEIIEDIKRDIDKGIYKPGKKIPSIRKMSEKYNCSKNTVIKAYETLKNNHIIYSYDKSGYYIVENIISTIDNKSEKINFLSGNTYIGQMNTPDLKHCLDRAADIYRNISLSDGIYGIESLRKTLTRYLADFQVFTSPNNIYVNFGIQQALSMLTEMKFPNKKNTILIEEPSYSFYIDYLKYKKIDVLGIERNENGIDLSELEEIFKNNDIKFFYTIPRNNNPLGTVYSIKERKGIAKLAKKYDVYIIEDDYFADVNPGKKYDPIYSYSDYQHTIYLKSFSKIMPWMRMGIIVMPDILKESFAEEIRKVQLHSYFASSLISQATLEIYIKSNMLNKHVELVGKELKEKQKVLKEEIRKVEKYGVRVSNTYSGFYKYIYLPDSIRSEILVKELKKSNVLVSDGSKYYINKNKYKNGIRVSIASVSKEEIRDGFNIINKKINEFI